MATVTKAEQKLLDKHTPWIANENINDVCTWTMPNKEDDFSEEKAMAVAEKQRKAFNSSLDAIFRKDKKKK